VPALIGVKYLLVGCHEHDPCKPSDNPTVKVRISQTRSTGQQDFHFVQLSCELILSSGGVPHALCNSIRDEASAFSWKSFVWLFALVLLDLRLERKERFQYKRTKFLKEAGSYDFSLSDYIDHDVYSFLARVPETDKVYVEPLVMMLTYLWRTLENKQLYLDDTDRFISGQPSSKLACDAETRAILIEAMSDKSVERWLFTALHRPEDFLPRWEDVLKRGMVFHEDGLRNDSLLKPMLRALRYSGSDTGSVFFRQQIFWR
jgi:hypothetical protein